MTRIVRVVRVTLVHLALCALGAWSVWAQLVYRTPSRYGTVLLAGLTVVGTGAILAFWLRALVRGGGATAGPRTLVDAVHRVCALSLLGSGFYGLFLLVNGKLVSRSTLHDGDVVRLGDFVLKLEIDEAPVAAPADLDTVSLDDTDVVPVPAFEQPQVRILKG